MGRARVRDLGITIGRLPTGPLNAITDVPDVLVGHRTLIADTPRVIRTGVTMIVPRAGAIWTNYAFAGTFSFNGNGEMTGLPWLQESGQLGSPIGITNTYAVGIVRDALIAYAVEHGFSHRFHLPVVAETFDGFLSDIDAFPVTREHVYEALAAAADGPVPEGNVGGGTGMRCHGFKGGIGTSSRIVDVLGRRYAVGVLVQANYGRMADLRIDGVPVGREIEAGHAGRPGEGEPKGSIIVIAGTDAPLIPAQCSRLARRATVGLARVGGHGFNTSGDLFLAFATGNGLSASPAEPYPLTMIPHEHIDPFFEAVADATEESILNALAAAETMTGLRGTVEALPLHDVRRIVARHRPAAH
ncbi:MAG TPA: P1 family peptidase [bacterium]|nr:P1 family peptidase [bacterium]